MASSSPHKENSINLYLNFSNPFDYPSRSILASDIDAGAFAATIENSHLIIEDSDSRACKTFGINKIDFLDINRDLEGVMIVTKI